jgi:hypothetical protein
VTARLGPDVTERLADLAAAADDDEADSTEPSALSMIKSVPSNVSLERRYGYRAVSNVLGWQVSAALPRDAVVARTATDPPRRVSCFPCIRDVLVSS